MSAISRRRFMQSSAALLASGWSASAFGAATPGSDALRVAIVGCGGKGMSDLLEIAAGNQIVALCDIDSNLAGPARSRFPEARFFFDFREMFHEMAAGIDVVTVSTPDHMHFAVAMEAMRRGKSVMVQKPLSNSIWECRMLAEAAKKHGVWTVMGNQGATNNGTRVLREWLEGGVIGAVKEVHYWSNRPIWPQGRGLQFPSAPVPEHVRWDLWQGNVARERAYSPNIHPFAWRGLWDYGCGALGDIGCHSFHSAFWCLDLAGDFELVASNVSEFDAITAPKSATLTYTFPAKGTRGPIKVVWQDGIGNPNTSTSFVRPPGIPSDYKLGDENGQAFVGTDGVLLLNDCYCGALPEVFPETLKSRTQGLAKVYPRVAGGPTQELCRAVRGIGPKPVSNFIDTAGPLTELVLAGNLALRSGHKIDWDSAALQARGHPELGALIRRPYRSGWEPDLG